MLQVNFSWFVLDIIMSSPPDNLDLLQGASRTTGGIIHGRAQGNVYNFADDLNFDQKLGWMKGRVLVYTGSNDSHPEMTMKHEVTRTLAPVLESLAGKYSPIKSVYRNFIFSFETYMGFRGQSIYLCRKG